jgi:hypothetical protein
VLVVGRVGLIWAAIVVMPCAVAQAQIDPSFTPEPYGHPVVSADGNGTTISVPDRPGGMYYRVALDPARTYRIRLHGEWSGGPFVLRLRTDDRAPVYAQVPNGAETYRVSGAERFELLLFRHYESDGETYLLRNLAIEDCTQTCLTDEDLKREIVADLPHLQDALNQGDNYRAALMLLDWASPRITGSSGGPGPIAADFRSAAELYYDFFRPGTGGVFCGGAAEFLKKLLDLFSVPAFQLNFGEVSWFTHAAVAVPVYTDGEVAYRLLDPTFRLHYTLRSNGEPLSIEQMLELWRAGRTDLIDAHAGGLGSRQIIVGSDRSAGTFEVVRCSSGSDLSTLCGLSSFSRISAPLFESHGYTADVDGVLRLLGTTGLLGLDYTTVPETFRDRLATFKDAVEAGDTSVRIAELPLPPATRDAPNIHGSAQVGEKVWLDNGEWENSPPVAYTRQWQRCDPESAWCEDIPAATGPSYVVDAADLGYRLRARVTASNEYGSSDPAVSRLSEVVSNPAPEVNSPSPTGPWARLSTHWLRGGSRLRLTISSARGSRLHVSARVRLYRPWTRGRRVLRRFDVPAGGRRRVLFRVPHDFVQHHAKATIVIRLWDAEGAAQVLPRASLAVPG